MEKGVEKEGVRYELYNSALRFISVHGCLAFVLSNTGEHSE